jgi:hypothetical protein
LAALLYQVVRAQPEHNDDGGPCDEKESGSSILGLTCAPW